MGLPYIATLTKPKLGYSRKGERRLQQQITLNPRREPGDEAPVTFCLWKPDVQYLEEDVHLRNAIYSFMLLGISGHF
jgi:hypothetical protein